MKFLSKPGKTINKIGKLLYNEEPVISIITPFYNGGKTLEETANSIFNQTYPYFEWIIVDDGSKSESCLKKLEEIKNMDPRIKVFHKENGGPSQARDFGISKSAKSSKYIYFLDCDDLIENTMLEEMYWALETHPNASWAYVSMINFGAYEYYWEPYFTLEEELAINTLCISSLIRKKDLLEVGCFGIKEKAMYEDWNLWLKLLAKGKSPIRLNAPLFWYRTSFAGELSRAKSNHKKAIKLIKTTAKTVKNEVDVVQFPRVGDLSPTTNTLENMTLPKYQKEEKKNIIFIADNINLTKNSIASIELIKRLSKDTNCILLLTEPSKNNLRQEIKNYVTEIHDLSNFLDTKDYPLFLNYLISSRNISNIIINNSNHAYAMIPLLKEKYNYLKITEILESTPSDIRNDKISKLIDTSLTTNKEISEKYKIDLVKIENKNLKEPKVDKTKLKEKYNISKDKIIISYIDNLTLEKNVYLFLKIAKNAPKEYQFIINGNGKLVMEIKNIIKKKNLTNILYIPEQENYDEIYKLSDIIVNCAQKRGVSATNYFAILNAVPIVTTTADYQEEIINDKIGTLVSENSSNPKDYLYEIENIISNLNKYKENIKIELKELTNKYDSLYNDILKSLNNIETKKIDESFMNEVYSQYNKILNNEFKEKYLTYYKEIHKITPRENIELGPISKKKKARTFALRYNFENEMVIILKWLKQVTLLLKTIKDMIINIFKTIGYTLLLVVNIIKIILKCIRKVLSFIKQSLLKLKKK